VTVESVPAALVSLDPAFVSSPTPAFLGIALIDRFRFQQLPRHSLQPNISTFIHENLCIIPSTIATTSIPHINTTSGFLRLNSANMDSNVDFLAPFVLWSPPPPAAPPYRLPVGQQITAEGRGNLQMPDVK
jgi:hypothetical protein